MHDFYILLFSLLYWSFARIWVGDGRGTTGLGLHSPSLLQQTMMGKACCWGKGRLLGQLSWHISTLCFWITGKSKLKHPERAALTHNYLSTTLVKGCAPANHPSTEERGGGGVGFLTHRFPETDRRCALVVLGFMCSPLVYLLREMLKKCVSQLSLRAYVRSSNRLYWI